MEVITMSIAVPAQNYPLSVAILAGQNLTNPTGSQLLALRIRGNGTG
jgi:hypothetical protein